MSPTRRLATALGAAACVCVLSASSVATHSAQAVDPAIVSAATEGPAQTRDDDPSTDGSPTESPAPAPIRDLTVDDTAGALSPAGIPPLQDEGDEPTLLELVRVPPPEPVDPVELPDGVDEDGFAAGIRGDLVGAVGSGELRVVAGSEPAPREAEQVYRVRVEVERGLPVERGEFAEFVMATLNDDRGWGHDGSVAFERVDSADADFAVTLADGPLSIDLCHPLDVGGVYSCGRNGRAVLNADRFGASSEPFIDAGGTLEVYRRYLVNHEVGHLIGHQHVDCPAPGEPAPVMVQQSMGLQGCTPNAWPAEQ